MKTKLQNTIQKAQIDAGLGMHTVRVTPEIAKDWLENYSNPKNRHIGYAVIANYARVMKNEKWWLNGESLCFDSNEMLLNGHHRLTAVIDSGTPIDIVVVTEIDPEAFASYDIGNRRSAGNVFQMADVPNATNVASIVSRLIIYEAAIKRSGSYNTAIRPTNEELLDRYNTDQDLYQFCNKAAAKAKSLIHMSNSGSIFSYAIKNCHANEDEVLEFVEKLYKGEMLVSGDPILTLRNALIKSKNDALRGKRPSVNWYMNACIIAWNAFREGKSIRIIRIADANKAIQIT